MNQINGKECEMSKNRERNNRSRNGHHNIEIKIILRNYKKKLLLKIDKRGVNNLERYINKFQIKL